ncbi:MAG: hypothetical protein AAFU57_16390, partial [Bacteroidota bacterium]
MPFRTVILASICLLLHPFFCENIVYAQTKQQDVYQVFDSLIKLENSGAFKGTVNLPYQNVRPENHPFYTTAEYQALSMHYD